MFISAYAYALGQLVWFTLLLNPSRVSSFHCSFHHFFVHIIILFFISSYANALGHLVCFTLLLNPSRVSSFHCSFHYFFVHFIISSFILIMCQCTWPFSVLPSYLTLLVLHHFITYILGSLIFKCMLDLWVYTQAMRVRS